MNSNISIEQQTFEKTIEILKSLGSPDDFMLYFTKLTQKEKSYFLWPIIMLEGDVLKSSSPAIVEEATSTLVKSARYRKEYNNANVFKPLYNTICQKIEDGLATDKERDFFCLYNSMKILMGIPTNNELINKCMFQIINNKDSITINKAFIFAQYSLNYLNQMDNLDVKFIPMQEMPANFVLPFKILKDKGFNVSPKSKEDISIAVHLGFDAKSPFDNTISLNPVYFYTLLNPIDESTAEMFIVELVYCLLREYQQLRILISLRGSQNLDESQMFKESAIKKFGDQRFVMKNHLGFASDKISTQYASEFIQYLLPNNLNKENIASIIEKMEAYIKKREQDNVSEINYEYDRIIKQGGAGIINMYKQGLGYVDASRNR